MSSSMSEIVSKKCLECPVLSGKVSKMSDHGSGRGEPAGCVLKARRAARMRMLACSVRVVVRVCSKCHPTLLPMPCRFCSTYILGMLQHNSGPFWSQTMIFGVLDTPSAWVLWEGDNSPWGAMWARMDLVGPPPFAAP
jgi:hypothetical protein